MEWGSDGEKWAKLQFLAWESEVGSLAKDNAMWFSFPISSFWTTVLGNPFVVGRDHVTVLGYLNVNTSAGCYFWDEAIETSVPLSSLLLPLWQEAGRPSVEMVEPQNQNSWEPWVTLWRTAALDCCPAEREGPISAGNKLYMLCFVRFWDCSHRIRLAYPDKYWNIVENLCVSWCVCVCVFARMCVLMHVHGWGKSGEKKW